ncbi:MAG: hypothetical protein ACOC1F_06370, partial [Myxococcota bacterium]
TRPTRLPSGGMARMRYESVWRDPVRCRERVDLQVETRGVRGCPERWRESHELLCFRAADLAGLIRDAGFHLLGVHAMEVYGLPECDLEPNCGVVTLVLVRSG